MSVLKPVITMLNRAGSRLFRGSWSGEYPILNLKLTQPFLQGQLPNCFADLRWETLLDTPDHFDYDSACTMILNLRATSSEYWLARIRTRATDGELVCSLDQ